MKRGVILLEILVVLAIGVIGLFAVTAVIVQSYRHWGTSRSTVSLQADLDLACLTIKAVLEEADRFTVNPDGNVSSDNITASASYGSTQWDKKFFRGTGGNSGVLYLRNNVTQTSETVIRTLNSLSFSKEVSDRVRVNISVRDGSRTIQTSFVVYVRNRG